MAFDTTFLSPSPGLEKGSYRMHAPRQRHPPPSPTPLSKSRSLSAAIMPLTLGSFPSSNSQVKHHPSSLSDRRRQLSILVLLFAFTSIFCFGGAYYLYITRLAPYYPGLEMQDHTNIPYSIQAIDIPPAADPSEQYLSYLSHSGLHNQLIAFANALLLAQTLNRTLLAPPLRLADIPIRYLPYTRLRRALTLDGKEGLGHCRVWDENRRGENRLAGMMPVECEGYWSKTWVPWDWLLDLSRLTEILPGVRMVQRPDMDDRWLFSYLGMNENTSDTNQIMVLDDKGPYDYRFVDSPPSEKEEYESLFRPSPSKVKYKEDVSLPRLRDASSRLMQFGTLFGSGRVRLHTAARSHGDLKGTPRTAHELLPLMPIHAFPVVNPARVISSLLGGPRAFLSAHVRVGDGQFLTQADDHPGGPDRVRKTWWRIATGLCGLGHREARELEAQVLSLPSNDSLEPPEGYSKPPVWSPALSSVQNASLTTEPHTPLRCRGNLHDPSGPYASLNAPLFVATDAKEGDPILSRFLHTFPCIFFLRDFLSPFAPSSPLLPKQQQQAAISFMPLRSLVNLGDGVHLVPEFYESTRDLAWLEGVIDAVIAGNSGGVVGTDGSTFTTYVEDMVRAGSSLT